MRRGEEERAGQEKDGAGVGTGAGWRKTRETYHLGNKLPEEYMTGLTYEREEI